ncbi:MAG TPA: hypothetical protein VMY35_07010 [Phycisphaerae bacterium]|nr:hypothetical protein [Phycisphaerae bacterium]
MSEHGRDKMMEQENGVVESTMLGTEDHGILTAWLHLKFNGTGQGFGGYAFDAFGCEFIRQVLKVLKVDSWEKLPGKPLRVRREHYGGPIVAIGHYIEDRWFVPGELANAMCAVVERTEP